MFGVPGEDLRDVLYIDDVVNFVDTAIKNKQPPMNYLM